MYYEVGGRVGLYFLGQGQFILHSFPCFEMQDFKNLKIFACGLLIFNIHIFKFKMDAELQVNNDFHTESTFYC